MLLSADRLLEKQKHFNRYLQHNPRLLSYASFVNIFLWKDFFQFHFENLEKHLCVFAKNESGVFLYLPPLGEGDMNAACQACFEYMKDQNQQAKVSRIENADHLMRKQLGPEYHCRLKYGEYYYYKSDLVQLRGNAYKSQRALYNSFVKNHSYQYAPYEKAMFFECMELLQEWTARKKSINQDPVFLQMLDENIRVNELAMEFFKPLGLVGRVVFVEGQIKAYTFGFSLSEESFCVLLEVADPAVKGLSCFIYREFLQDELLRPHQFINAMDAWGLQNVQRTKCAYRPVMLMSSYTVQKKEIG